jgi:outer membrane biosynthesis protein TonB
MARSRRRVVRAGSALAAACLLGTVVCGTAAIAVAAADSGDVAVQDATQQQQQQQQQPDSTTTAPPTQPPTTQPPTTQPPTTAPPTTAPPTTQPSTTSPTQPQQSVSAATQPPTSATFLVYKSFSDHNTANVTISLTCEQGTVANDDTTASEADPANFTVSGVSNTSKTCTATETPVSGYTGSGSPAGTCSAKMSDGSCTITNTKNTTNTGSITVTKALHPGNLTSSQSFSFTLSGSGGSTQGVTAPNSYTWTNLDTTATYTLTEGATSGWQLKHGGGPDAISCGSHDGVTIGTTSATIDLSKHQDVSCTFTNEQTTPASAPFVVHKDFSDNSTASVPVSVSCTSGTVTGSPTTMSHASPATVTVSGFTSTTGTTCTATETVPSGYTGSGSPAGTCSATLDAGTCTITNTVNSASFVARKNFSDNSTASVPVVVTCTSGTVTGGSGSMSHAAPLTATVTSFTSLAGTTCTATETVPSGYAGSGSPAGTCSATLAVGTCTITNTLSSASFVVNKNFSDNSTASVPVSVSCTSGTVSGSPTTMSHASPASVTVTGYGTKSGTTCTATETVPTGYAGSGSPAGTCSATLDAGACTITNTANSASFVVNKNFSDSSTASVPVSVSCTSGTVSGSPTTMSHASPASVTVTGYGTKAGTTCTATETVPSGYTGSGSPAGTCHESLATGSCTITNTLNEHSFVARKNFSDSSTASVSVNVTCTQGTVTGGSGSMSHASPLTATVKGYSSAVGTTCTATETVPSGYAGSGTPGGTCSATLDAGTCTITNTANSASFVVQKSFSDNSTASVPVSVSCTSGTVTGSPTTMSHASPASVTVSGYGTKAGTTCTATETVPSGYAGSGSPAGTCNATLDVGTCTITNTLNSASFVVHKNFSDSSTASVPVSVSCTSGTVSGSPTTMSHAAPATVTVSGYGTKAGTTCTATETVPSGYAGSGSPAGTCHESLATGSCTITNTAQNDGSITVTKKIKNGSDTTKTFDFQLTGPVGGGTVTLGDGQSHTFSNLSTAGSYTLTESLPDGWAVSSQCHPNSDISGNNPVTISLHHGDEEEEDSGHPNVTCTFTNQQTAPPTVSFKVAKDFSDDNTATVPVSLSCTDGSVGGSPTTMKEGSPASFSVSGYTSAEGTTCTATETQPSGYTGSGTPAGTCSAKLSAGTCTISNLLNSANFSVTKVFSPHSTESVPVSVSCSSGTVSGSPTTMKEGTPAVVTVKGFDTAAGTTCTATETVPTGYTGSGTPAGTCSASVSAAGCTITNTLNTSPFVVHKVFSDNSDASVAVAVSCGAATVAGSPTTMSQATAATVTVSHYADASATTCTATETVPSGYTADGDPAGSCSATLAVGTCTITNTLNTASFAVSKVFSDGSTTSVPITVSCSSGTVSGSPTSVAGGGSATVTVDGFRDAASTTCTATETSVPTGYTAENGGVCGASLSDGGCTLVNDLNATKFEVTKRYTDDNTASVPVSLECTTGKVTQPSLDAAPGSPAQFDVTGYTTTEDTTCTATETVPSGYTGSGTPAGTCSASLSDGTCEIVNSLNSANFTVSKIFSDHSDATVPVSVSCTSGTVSGDTSMSEAKPALVTVKHFADAQTTTCTATETVPTGYSGSGTPAGTCSASLSAAGCTITNTLNTSPFVARKIFSDGSKASVDVSIACGSATVTGSPTTMSQSSPANVTVSHYSDPASTTCTATETVPSGYTADGSPAGTCSATLDVSVCTITNTLNSASFQVSKVFDDGSTTTVPVSVSCTSGTVPDSPGSVAGGGSTTFTVQGFSDPASTTCTATETAVPPGYTASNGGECSASLGGGGDVEVEVLPGCTITNTLNTTTFEVSKQYSDTNTASVPVSLQCTGGTVKEPSLDASPNAPAQFTVTGFDDSDPGTCAATETTVPDGYTPDGDPPGTCTADLAGEKGGGCTITNTLNSGTFTVSKVFSPHSDASVDVSVSCVSNEKPVGGGNFSVTENKPAQVDVSGFTDPESTTCTATETTIPDGYTADGDPAGTCSASLADGGCTITNTLNSATFTVSKVFSDDNTTQSVTFHLTCTSGTVPVPAKSAKQGSPAEFTVEGYSNEGDVQCTATEDAIPGYTGDNGGLCTASLFGEGGGGCTIRNTKNVVPPPTATFTVSKSFSDHNPAFVTVQISCTSGGTSNPGSGAIAEGSPKTFDISGFSSAAATTCTATEVQPTGYTGNGTPPGSCSATLDATSPSCTITNTLNTATFTVSKSFSDGNTASVPVSVACTSGTVSGGSTTMSPGSPASVTVKKFASSATTTCTASESPVAGYTGSGSPAGTCSAVLSSGGCSITNTLIPPPPPPGPPAPPGPGPTTTPVITPLVTPPPNVSVGGVSAVRGTTSSLRRVLVAGEVVHVSGRAPAGCNPVLRVDGRLIGPVKVQHDGTFDVDVGTGDLDPGRHVAVVECTNPTAPLVTKVFWVAAPLSSSNILLVALSSMTMLFGLGWVGVQTLAGVGGGSTGAAGAAGKPE